MKRLIFFITLFLLAPALPALSSNHTELRFEGPLDKLVPKQEFQVKIIVFTSQPINAYSINFLYPKELIELIGFNDAGSVVNIWQTQPQVSVTGDVVLKGGSTTAHASGEGLVTVVKFRTLSTGSGKLEFLNSNVYLANGKGTKVAPEIRNLEVVVAEGDGGMPFAELEVKDDLAPNIENLSVIKNPINTDQKLLSFIVRDNESGVEQVNYKTRRWFWWSKSQPALNPTAFSSDIWSINFEVVDNRGNTSQQTIYDWSIFLKRVLPVFIIILGAFLLVLNRIIGKKKL